MTTVKACLEAGLLWTLAIKWLFRAYKEYIEARTANIHVFPAISALLRFVDFEALTIQASPPISTLLKYEIEASARIAYS
jgi:hypothetical protein